MSFPSISNPSAQDFEQAIAKNTPLIITDYFKSWSAMSKWSLDYLADNYGSIVVPSGGERKPLSSFINDIKSGKPVYMNQVLMTRWLPELMADIELPSYFRNSDRFQNSLMPASYRHPQGLFELFVGGPGSGFSKLHYDLYHPDVTIVQIKGSKHFRLFAPSDSPYLYINDQHPHLSDIDDAFNPSLDVYPDAKKATPYSVTLKEGEGIFVPSGWWHATKFDEANISVAFNTLHKSKWPLFVKDFLRDSKRSGTLVWLIQYCRLQMSNLWETIAGR